MAETVGGSIRIKIEDLEPLLRGLYKMEAETPKTIRRALLLIAADVSELAKGFAVGHGLVDDADAPPGGGLVDRIKPALRGSKVYVVDSARRMSARYPTGYSYPARYEYEAGGARAFMRPAIARSGIETDRRLADLFDHLAIEGGYY